jgi:hypothetical protein
MSIDVDLTFPHRFECEPIEEVRGGSGPHLYFPKGQRAGQDGVLLRVQRPMADAWIGLFAFGNVGDDGVSRILSMPDPEKVCVVAKGAGYLVSAHDPNTWESVRAVPIVDVRSIPHAGVVVFATHTDILAYGESGVRWRTGRLAWDRFKIVSIAQDKLVGEYWEIRDEAMQTFEVDLETGMARGGAGS